MTAKGLIVNNISGSERGPQHGDSSLIAVTGSMIFSKHGGFDLNLLDQDVSFYVDGTPGDNATAAKFAGDLKVSGSLTAESESTFNEDVYISGNTIVYDDIILAGNSIYFCEELSNNNIKFEDDELRIRSDENIKLIANEGNGEIIIVGRTILSQEPLDEWDAVNKGYVDALLGEGFKISSDESGEPSTTITSNDTIYFLATPNQTTIVIDENEVTFGLPDNVFIEDSVTAGNSYVINSINHQIKLVGEDLEISSTENININSEAGILNIKNNGDDFIIFNANTNELIPALDSTVNLGSETNRFANVFTGDLHLRNERGHWQIIEEENDLTIINRLTDERYAFVLEPYDGPDYL